MADVDNQDDILKNVVFVKQLGGSEDLMFGFGTIVQIRNGRTVVISKINAASIPFSDTESIEAIINKILDKYPL